MADLAKAFLGVGWSFPLAATDGDTSMAAYEEDIRQALLIILLTNHGERMMRPEFGAGLRDFLFEPINQTTLATMARQTREALVDWEPRVDVMDVTVAPDPSRMGSVLIEIGYRVRASNAVRNLVYPFYLGEGSAQ
jgi:phage baseplate assembly protein W